jgi:hypothetical protein
MLDIAVMSRKLVVEEKIRRNVEKKQKTLSKSVRTLHRRRIGDRRRKFRHGKDSVISFVGTWLALNG